MNTNTLEEQYQFLCKNNDPSDDMVGDFNIGNARKILTLLNEGKVLQYRHSVFGIVDVWMNNDSTIMVTKNKHITEDTIMTYIMWRTGKWYLNTYK